MKYFGWVSVVVGVGVVFGLVFGGLFVYFGYVMLFFFGVVIIFINFLFGYFYMFESLEEVNCLK